MSGEGSDPIPESFKCPMTLELMEDPVATVDGHVYDRAAIEKLNAMHLGMASKKQCTNHHEKWALAGEKPKDTDRWPENHPDEDARMAGCNVLLPTMC